MRPNYRIGRPGWNILGTSSSITKLTVNECTMEYFYRLLKHLPNLKYFRLRYFYYGQDENVSSDLELKSHLKELIIDSFRSLHNEFEIIMKYTPYLESLTISSMGMRDFLNAHQWEQLITTSLPSLTTFKFIFFYLYCYQREEILFNEFNEFRTDFWQEHQWFTKFVISDRLSFIYTIPYPSNTFKLPFKNKRYSNNPTNSFDRLDNVTNLILSQETSTEMSGYYFSNITSLMLKSYHHQTVRTKSIKSLQKIVNLKHLDITGTGDGRSTAGSLLKILKRTPELSSLAIGDIEIASLFEDEELCNYLNRIIKRLFIYRGVRASWNIRTYSLEWFYQTFGNVEHLRFETGYDDALVFWLNHLPKLSILRIKWRSKHKPRKYLFQLKNEIRKLNLIADITVKRTDRWYDTPDYDDDREEIVMGIDLRMWLGQNTSELLTNFTIVMNTLRKY